MKCPFSFKESHNSGDLYIDVLEKLSFSMLDKLKEINFIEALKCERLHYDKDFEFLSDFMYSLIRNILIENPISKQESKIISKNIGEIDRELLEHLSSLYTIAFLDIISMISVTKNLGKNKDYGIKILLMNMDGGTVAFHSTIAETVNRLVLCGKINELDDTIRNISSLNNGKKVCHFLSSRKKTQWLSEAWDLSDEKLFGAFDILQEHVNTHWDKIGSFHFGKI